MFKKLKHLKNQRGLTLIELLVVIVILGIIAAIAVPSIGGILNNSKVDAHIANANQMLSATRLAVTAGGGPQQYTMDYLIAQGYLESKPNNPGAPDAYDGSLSRVVVNQDATTGNFSYFVTLSSGSDQIHINLAKQEDLERDSVNLNGGNTTAVPPHYTGAEIDTTVKVAGETP